MSQKTAVVIGATGLVGSQLVQQLLINPKFSKVTIIIRKTTGIQNKNLEELVIDFDQLESFKDQITGDVLFSCLGTTIKQAKTKENQYKVDFTYQFQTAQLAAANMIPSYVLVSSTGASSKSRVFYSRIKGELEDAISTLPFKHITILRPSVLIGNRKDFRLGESISIPLITFFGKIIPSLRKWRGIPSSEVARAMIVSSLKTSPKKIHISELDEIFDI